VIIGFMLTVLSAGLRQWGKTEFGWRLIEMKMKSA